MMSVHSQTRLHMKIGFAVILKTRPHQNLSPGPLVQLSRSLI